MMHSANSKVWWRKGNGLGAPSPFLPPFPFFSLLPRLGPHINANGFWNGMSSYRCDRQVSMYLWSSKAGYGLLKKVKCTATSPTTSSYKKSQSNQGVWVLFCFLCAHAQFSWKFQCDNRVYVMKALPCLSFIQSSLISSFYRHYRHPPGTFTEHSGNCIWSDSTSYADLSVLA